jgi:hypothetical protein
MLKKLSSLNTVLRTIKNRRQELQISILLILEIVLHVTWSSAFIGADYLRDYCRPYTTQCNTHARCNRIGVSLVKLNEIIYRKENAH